MEVMRTNSPISDPEPLTLPVTKKPQKPQKSEWAELGKEEKYPTLHKYFEGRKEYFRRYLPGGAPIEELTEEARAIAWGQALVVIKEIEAIQATIEREILKEKSGIL